MSKQYIAKSVRSLVREKFLHRCAYCHTSAHIIGPFLEMDHIIPEAKGGTADEENLALACSMCNGGKSDRIEAIDPVTQQIAPLFHPRLDDWDDHFEWENDGATIRGKTLIGRATVNALKMNHSEIVACREVWISVGLHPPDF